MPGADAGITRTLASIHAVAPHINHPCRPDQRQHAHHTAPDEPEQTGLHETERNETAGIGQILHVIPFVKMAGAHLNPGC